MSDKNPEGDTGEKEASTRTMRKPKKPVVQTRATATARTPRLNKPVFQVDKTRSFSQKTEVPTKIHEQTNADHKETRAQKDPIVTSKFSQKTRPPTG